MGQDGWAEPNSFLNPNAAIIVTGHAFEGKQSVRVRGADLVPDSNISQLTSGYYAAEGIYRKNVGDFDVGMAGFPIVRVQAAVRLNGDHECEEHEKRASSACSNFFSASVTARAVTTNTDLVTDGVGELAISSDGKVYGYSGDDFVPGCPSPPNQPAPPSCPASFLVSAPIELGEYHILAFDVDFACRTFSFSVDGSFLGGPFPFPSTADTNILRRGSLLTYARPDTPQLHKTSFEAHYDNFSITTLPTLPALRKCRRR